MKLEIYKTDGKTTGEQVKLPPSIFEIEPNDHAIWLAATVEMNNQRQGTVATKNRSAVRGGGRKPWRQKGRGTARAGTIRSPLWVGGGRVFGPLPRNYGQKIPKKVKQLARRSVLTYRAKEDHIRLVEDFTFESPKTKQMNNILKNMELNNHKTLLLTSDTDRTVWLSSRNIPFLNIRKAEGFSVCDVLNAEMLLIQKSALTKISEVLKK